MSSNGKLCTFIVDKNIQKKNSTALIQMVKTKKKYIYIHI